MAAKFSGGKAKPQLRQIGVEIAALCGSVVTLTDLLCSARRRGDSELEGLASAAIERAQAKIRELATTGTQDDAESELSFYIGGLRDGLRLEPYLKGWL